MALKTKQILFNGFLLEVDSSAYLIKVRPANSSTIGEMTRLPDWIFRSSHAIWLTDGEESPQLRAILGDLIREQLQIIWEASHAA